MPAELPDTLQAVPATWTLLRGGSGQGIVVQRISVSNVTGGDLTLSVRDGQSSPVYFLDTYTVPAHASIELHPFLRFRSGVYWKASSTGLTGGMTAAQG